MHELLFVFSDGAFGLPLSPPLKQKSRWPFDQRLFLWQKAKVFDCEF
jgi:hypothetical protein